jgi:hypothetical protein
MTTQQQFGSLGCIAFALTKWIALKQWAARRGDKITEARADEYIADCKARGQRINKLGGAL